MSNDAASRYSPSCIEKSLSEKTLVAAAEIARERNPDNAPNSDRIVSLKSPLQLALVTSLKWRTTGVFLNVAFIDAQQPPLSVQNRILNHMNDWSAFCNVRFTLVQDPRIATVRITLQDEGYWSYTGVELVTPEFKYDPGRATMSLQGFTDSNPEPTVFARVVRHETGHTLGFTHEHLCKEIVDCIDRDKAISYYRRTEEWDDKTIESNVLTPADASDLTASPLDVGSIMCYMIPPEILKVGRNIPGGGDDFTAYDRQLAAVVYPFPPNTPLSATTIHTDPAIETIAASGNRLYKLLENGSVWRSTRLSTEWQLIDDCKDTKDIFTYDDSIYQYHHDGGVWVYTGVPKAWKQLDNNPDTVHLAVTKDRVYQKRSNGNVYLYKGASKEWECLDTVCAEIVATNDRLYQRHHDGSIYMYTEVGQKWKPIDNNENTVDILTTRLRLYKRHEDQVYVYSANEWVLLDSGNQAELIAGDQKIIKKHENGDLFVNKDNTAQGWEKLNFKLSSGKHKVVFSGGHLYELQDGGKIVARGVM